jgi:hypothetical protein
MTPTTKIRLMAAITRELIEEIENQGVGSTADMVTQMAIAIFNSTVSDEYLDEVSCFLSKRESSNE